MANKSSIAARLAALILLLVAGIAVTLPFLSEYWIPLSSRASLACGPEGCALIFDRTPAYGPKDELRAMGVHSGAVLLDRVLSYGTQGDIVYGVVDVAEGRWFVLDSADLDAEPVVYSAEAEWRASLQEVGVVLHELREPSLLDADWRAFDLTSPAIIWTVLLAAVFLALRAQARGKGAEPRRD